ncbi:alpha/beta hydrolase [Chloroflexota bacterium]
MTEQLDLSLLDRPEILEVVFPIVYSPFFLSHNLPFYSTDVPSYSIKVEKGIKISCGFWVSGKGAPSILYFHGNGEMVANYDWIAPFYTQRGINLFVADYRGYGSSNGKPTISNLLGDSHTVFEGFKEIISEEGFKGSLFLMGRSLGSIPAIELAFNYQEEIRGLIIESGTANNFHRLWSTMGLNGRESILSEDSLFLNKVKIRQVKKPTLIIHGEYDELIFVEEGKELYRNSASPSKRILIIPGAGHNDIMMVEQNLYFDAIKGFVKTYG